MYFQDELVDRNCLEHFFRQPSNVTWKSSFKESKESKESTSEGIQTFASPSYSKCHEEELIKLRLKWIKLLQFTVIQNAYRLIQWFNIY